MRSLFDPRVTPATALRATFRWVGASLIAASMLPVGIDDQRLVTAVSLAGEGALSSLAVALTPAVAGATLLVCSMLFVDIAALAVAAALGALAPIVASIAGSLVAGAPGEPVLPHVSLALSLPTALAIASTLTRRDRPALRGAAIASVVAVLSWPAPNEAPLLGLARLLWLLLERPHPGAISSALVLLPLALWPLVASLALPAVPLRGRPLLAFVALPSLASPWALSVMLAAPSPGLLSSAGEHLAFTACLLALSLSAAHLVRHRRHLCISMHTMRRLAPLLALPLAALAAPLLTSRRAAPAQAPSAEATPADVTLYEQLLPDFNRALRADRASANERGKALVASARARDAELGGAFDAVVSAALDGDASLARWGALVDGVNRRASQLASPYHLDPTGRVVSRERAYLRLDVYRAERTRSFRDGSRVATALHLRRIGGGTTLLGLSRDASGRALVVIDAISDHAHELSSLATSEPPRCTHGDAPPTPLQSRCTEALASLSRHDLSAVLLASVERHELQHQLDGTRLAPPHALWPQLASSPLAVRAEASRELHAYLTELAQPGPGPRLAFVRLARFASLRGQGLEGVIARVAISSLGELSTLDVRDDAQIAARARDALTRGWGNLPPTLQPL